MLLRALDEASGLMGDAAPRRAMHSSVPSGTEPRQGRRGDPDAGSGTGAALRSQEAADARPATTPDRAARSSRVARSSWHRAASSGGSHALANDAADSSERLGPLFGSLPRVRRDASPDWHRGARDAGMLAAHHGDTRRLADGDGKPGTSRVSAETPTARARTTATPKPASVSTSARGSDAASLCLPVADPAARDTKECKGSTGSNGMPEAEYRGNDEGSVRLDASSRPPAAEPEELLAAEPEELLTAEPEELLTAEPDDPLGAHVADALAMMAWFFLAHVGCGRDGEARPLVVVHVADPDPGPGTSTSTHLERAGGVTEATLLRLACDAEVVAQHTCGTFLDLGRTRRRPSAALRRALASRDRSCRFPGCSARAFIEAHHLRHWAQGGETSLENLVLLCSFHHRLVHEGGFTLRREANGTFVAIAPSGLLLEDRAASRPP
jgi:hypothetical protein